MLCKPQNMSEDVNKDMKISNNLKTQNVSWECRKYVTIMSKNARNVNKDEELSKYVGELSKSKMKYEQVLIKKYWNVKRNILRCSKYVENTSEYVNQDEKLSKYVREMSKDVISSA